MRPLILTALLIALSSLAAPGLPAAAGLFEPLEIIQGQAVALDGATLLIEGKRVRLFGIDAPEMRAPFGPQSRATMDDLIAGQVIYCHVVDTDRHKRPVARCRRAKDDGDLAKLQLMEGMATAHRLYTYAAEADRTLAREYDASERMARSLCLGLWAWPVCLVR